MKTPDAEVDAVVARLHAQLREAGFAKRGRQLGIRSGSDWGLIYVQQRTVPSGRLLTVNLGVYVNSIAVALHESPLGLEFPIHGDPRLQPSVYSAHWQRRIGNMMPPAGNDRWWDASSVEEVRELEEAVHRWGVPAVRDRLDARRLCTEWLSPEVDADLGRPVQLLFAAILAYDLGDRATARDVLQALGGLYPDMATRQTISQLLAAWDAR